MPSTAASLTRSRRTAPKFAISPARLAIAAGLCAALPAHADLRKVPGINEVQFNLANSIQTVCPKLAADTARTDQEENLFITCNRMIHTSNAQQDAGPSDNALPLTEEQLVEGLGEIAHEEALARVSKSRDTADFQNSNIAARLGALRAGGARGPSGVAFRMGDQWLASANDGALVGRGGSAGDGDGSRWSVFINGGVGFGDKAATQREDGFVYDEVGATVGADFALSANAFLGAAVGYGRTETEFDATQDDGTTESTNLALYGTHFVGTWYIDGIISYGDDDYQTTRDMSLLAQTLNQEESATLRGAVPELFKGATTGTHTGISVSAGRNLEAGPTVWSPYARYSYYTADVDAYSEDGNSGVELSLPDQEIETSQLVVGMDVTRNISSQAGVLSPQLRFEYHRQLSYNSVSYPARYKWDTTNEWWNAPSDESDRNYLVLGAGVSLVSAGGSQTFVYYETTQDLKNVSSNVFLLGWRKEL